MIAEIVLPIVLLLATLLCALVAGSVLLFAIVVMPGLGALPDREFLRAFQVIDKMIQDNQPVFIFVWLGSVVSLLVAAVLGVWQFEGFSRILIVLATALFIAGVQLPTMIVNIPLNNRLQSIRLEALDDPSLAIERQNFEPRWNRWNVIRSAFASLSAIVLLIVVRLF